MPAIQLTVLKKQTNNIAKKFNQPDKFIRELGQLFDYYSNRIHRTGESGEPEPIQDHFNLPKPLISQLQLKLNDLPSKYPDEALDLCNRLWSQPYLEYHSLSSFLLGQIPVDRANEIFQIVENYVALDYDTTLLDTIADKSMEKIRKEKPNLLLKKCEDWIYSPNINLIRFSWLCLSYLVIETNFENLPGVFTLIGPSIREIDERFRLETVQLIISLVKRSSFETAYLLKKHWEVYQKADTAWLIRQCIEYFSPELQLSLRESIRTR
jgi:hypothetical protein